MSHRDSALASPGEGNHDATDDSLAKATNHQENTIALRRSLFEASVALREAIAHASRRQRLCATAVSEWASAVAEAERCARELKRILAGRRQGDVGLFFNYV